MTAAAIAETLPKIVAFMTKHPADSFRPVPLAKAIGESDIRKVRAALRQLKAAGDVVSCSVYRGDEPVDEEYRIIAATMGGKPPPLGQLSKRTSRAPGWKPLTTQATPAPPVKRPTTPQLVEREIVPAKPTRTAQDALKMEVTASAPAITIAPSAAAPIAAICPGIAPDKWRGVQQGPLPARQVMIEQEIERAGRPLTAGELLEAFRNAEPELLLAPITTAIWTMVGCTPPKLVECGSAKLPGKRRMRCYATPTMAARGVASIQTPSIHVGQGGGDTNVAAVESTVAQRGDEALVPSATSAAPSGGPGTPLPGPSSVTHPLEVVFMGGAPARRDTRAQLEEFMRANDGGWYSLAWMTRVAAGDIVATLEALADWHRAGRVMCGEADKVPVWRAVRGAW
jgi:hypothetical protein